MSKSSEVEDQLSSIKQSAHFAKVDLLDAQRLWEKLPDAELKARMEQAHNKLRQSEDLVNEIRKQYPGKYRDLRGVERADRFIDRLEEIGMSGKDSKLTAKRDIESAVTAYINGDPIVLENEAKTLAIKQKNGINESKEPKELDDPNDSTVSIDFPPRHDTGTENTHQLERENREIQHKLETALYKLRISENRNADLSKKIERIQHEKEQYREKCRKLEEQSSSSHSAPDLVSDTSSSSSSNNIDNNVYLNTVRGRIRPYNLIKIWRYDSTRLKDNRQDLRDEISFLKLQALGYQEYIKLMENVLGMIDVLPKHARETKHATPRTKLLRAVLSVYFVISARAKARVSRKAKTAHKGLFEL